MAGIPPARRAPLVLPLLLLVAVAVLGGGGYVAYRLVSGSSDAHARMVPASAHVYSTVLLDPPGSQKVALLNLATRFPNVHNDQDTSKKVNDQADTALKSLGLKYRDDVQPWLGSQVSVAATLGKLQTSTAAPADFVVLLASKDDQKAVAALEKARRHRSDLSWSKRAYGGIDVWVGKNGSGDDTSYAYVDHTVVVGNNPGGVDGIIDADQGKVARLSDSKDFQEIVGRLPADHLVLGYVDIPSIAARVKAAVRSSPSTAGVKVNADQLKQLDAYRSAGFTVSAQSDRVVLDVQGGVDGSKLDAAAREGITGANHRNALLSYIPGDVYGAFGSTGLKQTIKQLQKATSDSAPATGSGSSPGSLLPPSLTDPGGALSHAGTDVAAEVRDGGNLPAGALLFQTDDPSSTTQFVQGLLALFSPSIEGSIEVVPPARPGAPPTVVHRTPAPVVETYRGVSITTMPASPSLPVQPAYAVSGGVAMVGTSTAEVRALVDTHAGHENVTTSAGWKEASRGAGQPLESAFFVDIQRSLQGIRQRLSGSDLASFNSSTRDAAPLRELFISSQSTTSRYSEQFVLVIR